MANDATDWQALEARSHRAPGPRGNRLLGTLPEVWRRGPLEPFVESWRRYGDVVRFRMGPDVFHLIAHPDDLEYVLQVNRENFQRGTILERRGRALLGNGLLMSEGALWERQRQIIEPLVAAGEVSRFGEGMVESAERTLASWESLEEHPPVVDIHREMLQLATRVICEALFGADMEDGALEVGQALGYFIEELPRRINMPLSVPLFVPTHGNRRFLHQRRVVYEFLDRSIAARRRSGHPGDDLLSRLIAARHEEDGPHMSEQQLRDEVLALFVAGQETTALALTWVWYLLAQHPEVEAALHTELDDVLGGRSPTAADAPNLQYTRRILWETLRLYPPIWGFMQKVVRADEIRGFKLPAGSVVILSPYITHRHPAVWENPEIFDPGRMTRSRAEGLPHYAFFPFSGGRHKCIGREYATLEAQLVLATIAQRYRLRLTTNEEVPAKAQMTLRPARPIRMALEPR